MKTINYPVILWALCLILVVSCRNHEIDPEPQSQITFIEISRYTTDKNDVYDIPFENEHAIKLFIYQNIIRQSGEACNIIRLMNEPGYLLYATELNAIFPLKRFESGNKYLQGLPSKEPDKRDESDGLDYSSTYMFDNKVCCITIEKFELSGDSKTLDIPVVFFRGLLDAFGMTYRFKKEGKNWYLVGRFASWVS